VETLLAAGHHAIDLGRWIEQGRPPVDRGFAICFDDGLRSILKVVDILSRFRVPATIFVVAGRVGLDNNWPGQPACVPREPLLDWSELADLARRGFTIGSHGWTHCRLSDSLAVNLDQEIVRSRASIEDRLGLPCPLLAYPYGAVDERSRAYASRYYAAAFGTRLAYAKLREDLHQLSRVDAYYLRSSTALNRLVAGRWRVDLAGRRTLRALRQALLAG
jgi:peptidoglycan/xylan/chitin deacetylase (PgdA/CDA1 family)